MKNVLIIIIAGMITGCGMYVSNSQWDKAVKLCEANSGVESVIAYSRTLFDVQCKNKAVFTNTRLTQ